MQCLSMVSIHSTHYYYVIQWNLFQVEYYPLEASSLHHTTPIPGLAVTGEVPYLSAAPVEGAMEGYGEGVLQTEVLWLI